ncbi:MULTISPECIES: polyprenyl synthetase family protein [Pseudobutyrivibrio]|uniref:Farnesyl diphosphate synthase n=2 Tax=Pseudobutyrivibrio TaxID=46205 RepID=A0A2G3E9U8_9FIRM|nr:MULTISPECIES: farnesyl diphosphate synthase [Pseudobutyrivibrio]MBE5903296.1 polyprenyl synthetase family protein [Pseudobutyrivibrio sp.]NEX00902.1 polyprenyl synthetase family protein [Pseudobutyrivibrio xylanivorans]PHU40076.1 farnesyl-diphosphate synthase [Pseudobutyrivibrio ruminis]SCX84114.1 geranylgeranyl diphosphate synthase, type II [Pseudobutyrivibrio sp. AR14]SFR63591.1 geranylgeranyl diphosphate synthase, type II [Pseudobutyrivibrio sp. NOR37]
MDIKNELLVRAESAEDVVCRFLPDVEGHQGMIFDAMEYSVTAGGKRLRPILMNETYIMFGGKSDVIEPFMAAIEMIHTYSLVHDDLPAMDNDMLRRGKPTTHATYGEAMGILTGDALLNYAFETALNAYDAEDADVSAITSAMRILARKAGVFGMIGGQVVDVMSEKHQLDIDEEKLHFIYELKTGALIEASMMIGAALAGASEEEITTVESVASMIGMAFQIQDDILDIEGDEAKLGKPIGSDERNEKSTYVTFAGIEKSKQEVRRLTDEAIDKLNSLPKKNEFLVELLNYLVYRDN